MIFTLQPLLLKVGLISTLILPTLLQDIIGKADKWGDDSKIGRIDPFAEIYDMSLLEDMALGAVLSFLFLARSRHDSPYDHM